MCTYSREEADVAQNLVDYFLSLTVGRPFHSGDLGEGA